MKKPVVNYREFRLSKLNTPEFSHLKLLAGWIGYFILYFLTENLIPQSSCHLIHCKLDDLIPFCEVFLIPYVFWYLLIVISLGYFMLYDIDSFKKLQTYIIITQVLAMIVYIFYPNWQDLRPDPFPRSNFFTACIGLIYAFDTPTGVFPSLHCAYSIGILSVWLRAKDVSKGWKVFVLISVILICLSTMFIKQHSALDFLGALVICIPAEILVYRVFYPKKKKVRAA